MNLKEVRLKAGLTQKELSEFTGIPKRTIGDWECNKRELKTYILDLIIYKLEHEGLLKNNTKE